MRHRTLRQRAEGAAARAMMRLPPRVLSRLAGRAIARDGYLLDPQLQLALALHARLGKRLTHQQTVAEAREDLEANASVFAPAPRELDRVDDRRIPGGAGEIGVRVYRPRSAPRPAPALVYYHGGGFVLGSLDSHDALCRTLADDARCVVVAVDYRLAPEHRFPAAPDDTAAAFRWVARSAAELGVDPARIAVGGDSAGGNLAAVVALEVRGEALRPAFQLLVYPAVDFTLSFPSMVSVGKGFLLERPTIEWFIDRYLPAGHDRRDPRASPLFAADHAGLPPAFIQTAGFDPLRDEGRAYADKLRAAGVAVEHRCFGTLFHGYFSTSGSIHAAREAVEAASDALRRAFA